MAEYLTNDSELESIADAIRRKGETASLLEYPEDFITAIGNIDEGHVVLVNKSVSSNGIYEANDDNADGYSEVVVSVSPGKLTPYEFDFTGGYIQQGKWTWGSDTVCYTDMYQVDPGLYLISLDGVVGTRFRAMFSTTDIATTHSGSVTGTAIVNVNDPVAYKSVTYTVAENGYISIMKDNNDTAGIKTHVYKTTTLVDESTFLASGLQEISSLDEYSVINKAEVRVSSVDRAKIIPENIRKDISILGVIGTYEGSSSTPAQLFSPVVVKSGNVVTFGTNPSNGGFNVITIGTVNGVEVQSPLTITSELEGKTLVVESTSDNFESSTLNVVL